MPDNRGASLLDDDNTCANHQFDYLKQLEWKVTHAIPIMANISQRLVLTTWW